MEDLTILLLRARDGDRTAFASFVRASQADVWRFCAHLVDRDSADDLTQDVYVRAMRAAPRFRGEASARTWLLAIARRTCADAIRSRQRGRRLLTRLDPRPDVHHDRSELELASLLAELDTDRREAFVLTQLLGFSYEEAAATLDVPVGTIRSRVSRARADLVGILAATGADPGMLSQRAR